MFHMSTITHILYRYLILFLKSLPMCILRVYLLYTHKHTYTYDSYSDNNIKIWNNILYSYEGTIVYIAK